MGLDITVLPHVELTEPHERTDDCWDSEHQPAYCFDGMEASLDDLEAGRCYVPIAEGWGFRAGSYSGYNAWREWLAERGLGVPIVVAWDNPDRYKDEPFWELLNFADNEGTIGPEAAARLFDDFQQNRDRVIAGQDEYMVELYDTWMRAFENARYSGMVVFH